ncbi:hypothetical protein ACFQ0G_43830 [Streptomyces chiangmaiensis]
MPLSTLTHELDGGARWPEIGEWEAVTEDLLQLIRDRDCDALNLCLPDIARALVCAARAARSAPSTPSRGGIGRTGPPTGSRSSWRSAGNWPGQQQDLPCGPATACCPRSTPLIRADGELVGWWSGFARRARKT